MRDYIYLLIDFHYWARDRALDAAAALSPDAYTRDTGSSFPSVRDTLVHLLSADGVWYQRWLGGSPTAHLLPEHYPDVDTLRRAWTAHEAKVRSFVESRDETSIEEVYTYTLFNGTTSTAPLWQMVTHVVNHGTYHRGQITTLLRQLGAAPAKNMDLITYYRERL